MFCRDSFEHSHVILLEISHFGPCVNALRLAGILLSDVLLEIGLTRRVLFNQVQCIIECINFNRTLRNLCDATVYK